MLKFKKISRGAGGSGFGEPAAHAGCKVAEGDYRADGSDEEQADEVAAGEYACRTNANGKLTPSGNQGNYRDEIRHTLDARASWCLFFRQAVDDLSHKPWVARSLREFFLEQFFQSGVGEGGVVDMSVHDFMKFSD